MEGIIKEALIKVVTGNGPDRVMIIENLPKKFIYQRVVKRVPKIVAGYATEADEEVAGVYVDELLEGITLSQTGDGGFVFYTHLNESAMRLKDLDSHVERNIPRDQRINHRVSYSSDPGDPRAPAIAYSQIPRNVLPILDLAPLRVAQEPVSPPVELKSSPEQEPVSTPSFALSPEEFAEYQDMKNKKQAAQERMAKAREARVV